MGTTKKSESTIWSSKRNRIFHSTLKNCRRGSGSSFQVSRRYC